MYTNTDRVLIRAMIVVGILIALVLIGQLFVATPISQKSQWAYQPASALDAFGRPTTNQTTVLRTFQENPTAYSRHSTYQQTTATTVEYLPASYGYTCQDGYCWTHPQ